MSPLLQQFVQESRDILETMGEALLALEKRPGDEKVIDELFRAVHTLKGNSGLFELPTFTRVVHAAEDVLDRVRDRELSIDPDLTDELLNSMDFIQRMIERVDQTGTIPSSMTDEAAAQIERLRNRLPGVEAGLLAGEDEPEAERVAQPASLAWLKRLDEEARAALYAELAGGRPLMALRYIPEPECFFKGEDPLLLLRNLPGLRLFTIAPLEPWAEGDALDIYRCNLEIQALATASRAELEDHVRYVPEQVAIYGMRPEALAMPVGEAGGDPSMRQDFAGRAAELLASGDRPGLSATIEAFLDLVNPGLKAASALRWLARLIRNDASAEDLSQLLEAFSSGEDPHWPIGAEAQATHAVEAETAGDEQQPAEAATIAAPLLPQSAWRFDPVAKPRLVEIVETQRHLLDIAVADELWDGRLAAIGNTLAGVFRAAAGEAGVAELRAVLAITEAGRDFLPLAFYLDEKLSPDDEPAEEMLAASPGEAAAPARALARSPTGETPATETAGEHGEKSARVLKVPQEKIDKLMDLIGEMVVAKNALPYLAQKAEEVYGSRDLAREIKAQFAVINRIAEDMQDGIMQVRMLPMGSVFQRFPRLVRDVSKQLDKKVRLVLEGEDAEADKHIVESLGDPLIHILRNSLDHGLEKPEVRRAAGKPEEGRILVRATQEGDRVLIEIADDGKGIDPAVIKRKAFEKGLIDEARLETISDADAVQLVFAPGFSTADAVSNLSGRGVGMDVVKTSLEKIGGQVRLTSEKGKGTHIELTLPLSVAVSNVLMVRMGGQRYGVPMDVVVETVRVPSAEIHVIKDRKVAVLRGRVVPLFGADELLQIPEAPVTNVDGEYAVLVARVDGNTVGIIVDGFAQTTDVILKPLEGPLSGLPGFAGSALLGDGSVLLVLDLRDLL